MHSELSRLTISLDRFLMDAHAFEAAATFLCEFSDVEAQLLGMLRCFRRLKKLSLPRFWITTSVLAVVADLLYLETIGWEPFAIWTEHVNDVDIINFAEPDRSLLMNIHANLEEIAQRWPDLTHLSLTSDPYIESHPRLTLSAPVSFATHCPGLTHVTLYLDLTAPFPSTPTPCLSNIQLIHVGTSLISREAAKPTALFLSLLCSTSSLVVGPSKQLRLQVNVQSGPSWDPVLYDDIPRERKNAIWKNCEVWEMVDEDLPYLVAAREAGSERLRVLE
ncbi:hypothetical protein BU17DRAFT_88777 [Hysterangium stoloniferum]|nr:hypothetical protein BU17DRAFT_88777 [Hysterangium stoloniferum]